MRKLGHKIFRARLLRNAKPTLLFLEERGVSLDHLLECIQRIEFMTRAQNRLNAETQPLLHLLATRKSLKRLSETLKRRGPKDRALAGLVAARFNLPRQAAPTISRRELLKLHARGKRRPREDASTLAMLTLADFFILLVGQRCYEHVASVLNAVFPELGPFKMNTVQKRLEEIPPEPWVHVPPTHKLGGDGPGDRRPWVLLLMQQASRDVMRMELEKFKTTKVSRRAVPSVTEDDWDPVDYFDAILTLADKVKNAVPVRRVKKVVGERTFSKWIREWARGRSAAQIWSGSTKRERRTFIDATQ